MSRQLVLTDCDSHHRHYGAPRPKYTRQPQTPVAPFYRTRYKKSRKVRRHNSAALLRRPPIDGSYRHSIFLISPNPRLSRRRLCEKSTGGPFAIFHFPTYRARQLDFSASPHPEGVSWVFGKNLAAASR